MQIPNSPSVCLVIFGAILILLALAGSIGRYLELKSKALRVFSGVLGVSSLLVGVLLQVGLSSSSTPDLSNGAATRGAWTTQVPGTYEGKLEMPDGWAPVTTTFVLEEGDGLKGTYVIDAHEKTLGGRLSSFSSDGNLRADFTYEDDQGSGRAHFQFAEPSSFEGYWESAEFERFQWIGHRQR